MSNKTLNQLSKVFQKIHNRLVKQDQEREKLLRLCRESIRLSATSIRSIHRREWEKAEKILQEIGGIQKKLSKTQVRFPKLYYSGAVYDSQKEWVEAAFLYAFLKGNGCPCPEELQVEGIAFLKGVGEAVGELRRYVLDRLRKGAIIEEDVLDAMDSIHYEMMKFDFPDPLTPGLRRLSDQTRFLVEKTRGDITMASIQRSAFQDEDA